MHAVKRISARCLGKAAIVTIWLAGTAIASTQAPPVGVELRDGDRVLWLGGTFVERMQTSEYIETALTAGYPDRQITFRNLGWSGDTVFGQARAVFGSAEDGFQRLLKDTREARPTVILLAYGANEAHDGPEGLARFEAGLARLLDELNKSQAQLVLLLPRDYESVGPPLPSPADYNRHLALYRDKLREVAERRGLASVDLNSLVPADERLTDNGIHLTPAGYARIAPLLSERLGARPVSDWPRLEPLRAAIQKKNELYFHRYRPQNETYLFLFRKHEQGNNAVEIPKFDPLVEAQESVIAQLRANLSR